MSVFIKELKHQSKSFFRFAIMFLYLSAAVTYSCRRSLKRLYKLVSSCSGHYNAIVHLQSSFQDWLYSLKTREREGERERKIVSTF